MNYNRLLSTPLSLSLSRLAMGVQQQQTAWPDGLGQSSLAISHAAELNVSFPFGQDPQPGSQAVWLVRAEENIYNSSPSLPNNNNNNNNKRPCHAMPSAFSSNSNSRLTSPFLPLSSTAHTSLTRHTQNREIDIIWAAGRRVDSHHQLLALPRFLIYFYLFSKSEKKGKKNFVGSRNGKEKVFFFYSS